MKNGLFIVIGTVVVVLLLVFVLFMVVTPGNPFADPTEGVTFDSTEVTFPNGLEKVLEMKNFYYIRDKVTDVMYICYREKTGYSGMGGIAVMLDPENSLPLTYERYLELEARQEGES